MSKLAATLSIALAAGVFFLLGGAYAGMTTVRPAGNDGDPVGFRAIGKQNALVLSGTAQNAATLAGCIKNKACVVEVDFNMPKTSTVPAPSPCPTTGGACFQFTGTLSISSRDWQGNPHPEPPNDPEQLMSSGTIYIAPK